jgi:hypothetical protein
MEIDAVRVALCTTTINVPHVLKLYRACDPDVRFFVALDKNTPREAAEFVLAIDNASVCMVESGHKWKCSELIGFNCMQRRNIAFLEALKWGADIIYSCDDDNLPMDMAVPHHFQLLRSVLDYEFDGLCARGKWFDPGKLLVPYARQRGIPHDADTACTIEPITNAKVGVAAGLVLGDPDIAATTRMENHPEVYDATALGRAGIAVHPDTRTVHNTQATAFLRELVPCMFLMPGLGRFDDIFASLVTRRIMRERGLHTHYGPPMVWQSRNKHNLISDLKAEISGMEHIEHFAHFLDSEILPNCGSVISHTAILYDAMRALPYIPARAIDAAMAYLDDCEQVIK